MSEKFHFAFVFVQFINLQYNLSMGNQVIKRRRWLVFILLFLILILSIRLFTELASGEAANNKLTTSVNYRISDNKNTELDQPKTKEIAPNNTVLHNNNLKWITYSATAYGPPWDSLNGTGVTATGIELDGPACIIAVDPDVIAYHSTVIIKPSLHSSCKTYKAEDTGGAIIGSRIDIYDWRGRETQYNWGIRDVKLAVITDNK
jgi:3D (Asp-Asp-Asp) domain-containing protein